MIFKNFDDYSNLNESHGNVCKKICNDCPFSKKSIPGWLADYSVQDLVDFQNSEALFPCHKLMPDDNLDQTEITTLIETGKIKLCRGYVESMIKSAKMPKYNQYLKAAIIQAKAEGLAEDSMPIWEFKKHHTVLKPD